MPGTDRAMLLPGSEDRYYDLHFHLANRPVPDAGGQVCNPALLRPARHAMSGPDLGCAPARYYVRVYCSNALGNSAWSGTGIPPIPPIATRVRDQSPGTNRGRTAARRFKSHPSRRPFSTKGRFFLHFWPPPNGTTASSSCILLDESHGGSLFQYKLREASP
eukprot:2920702-Rhodomonas_salina.1